MIIILDMIVNLVVFVIIPDLKTERGTDFPPSAHASAGAGLAVTPTVYLPLQPTLTTQAIVNPILTSPTDTPNPAPTLKMEGVDFGHTNAWIMIRIFPDNKRVNKGKPIVIKVLPGSSCYFGDHRACIGLFGENQQEKVIFVTVHSGVGGEAEAFRRSVEGLGPNRAAYPLSQIQANLWRLNGARVEISQGDQTVGGYQLVTTARVPATMIKKYFKLPIDAAIEFAAQVNPDLKNYLKPEQPTIVFETCGWKLESEPWAPGVTSTTGSVYLGVIQKTP